MVFKRSRKQWFSIESEPGSGGALRIQLRGRVGVESLGELWRKAIAVLDDLAPGKVLIDLGAVEYLDSAAAAFFADLRRRVPGGVEVRACPPAFEPLVGLFEVGDLAPLPASKARGSFIEDVGRASAAVAGHFRSQAAFVGQLVEAAGWALRHFRRLRWKEILAIAEAVGVNAFPIIALIGFLLGLILAFQSALPLRQFGTEVFVADLLGISMLKELGPLMTAIVLAGRSGSAFAAELGTMKVNEELDALSTMGLDPIRFLVVQRIIAAVLMTPILAVFCSLLALVGGAVVLLGMGYPLVTYVDHVISAVTIEIFLAGLIKSAVFAGLVAGVGCLRGLETGQGARAVGASTTSAVVSSIILVAVADAVFAVVQYALNI
jgi:phospholipid/cholesterol/gamma-HCH transport system permease protein